jgi:putative membrane protein
MDASHNEKPVVDLREYLAEERTFLAWIRTGVALMAFGLVVAQFELFAGERQIVQHAAGAYLHRPSLWFGTALVAIGVAVHLLSAWRYTRLVGELSRGQFVQRAVSKQGVFVALFLAMLGIAITIYLISTLGQPAALHAQTAICPLA